MLKLQQPTTEQFDLIYGEFGTSRERIHEDVQTLITWLEKQAHLPNIKNEEYLEHFLLRCKNSIEHAKKVLDRYFSLKTDLPEVYENRDPYDKGIIETMKVISFVPTPELTPQGSRVSIFRILQPEKYEEVDSVNVIKSMIMSGDLRLQIDNFQSDIFIFDLENFSMPIVTLILANLRKFILPGTRGIPMRQKIYYIINAKPSTESLIMMAKSILPRNLTQKLNVLKSPEDLLEVIPRKCLPKDYGGELPLYAELNEAWISTLQHYASWFKEQDDLKADNSKRLNREESRLGDIPLDGSFRQMNFD